MNRVMQWTFDSERRLLQVAAASIAVLIITFGVSTMLVLTGRAGPMVTPDPALPAPSSTTLVPPSPAPERPSPFPTYGPAAPIALEAVQAWLVHDVGRFSSLALPAAVEEFDAAKIPTPGQSITGDVTTLQDGPTRQVLQVPTTNGPMDVDLEIIDGAWMVSSLAYHR